MGRGSIDAQRMLLRKMRGGVNAYNHVNGNNNQIIEEVANIPIVSGQKLVTVGQGLYNPPFKAQIQLNVLKFYFTKATAGTIYTTKLPANLDASLKVKLPFFTFSNSDFDSGFSKLKGQYPITNWSYRAPFIFGRVTNPGTDAFATGGGFSSAVLAQLKDGDLILPFTAVTAVVGEEHNLAIIVIRTSDVPYGTLLGATNSNTFKLNLLRYTTNVGQEVQFSNAILAANETMFGKFTSDPVNPESFKNPEQDQDNIIDVEIDFDVNKQTGLSSLTDFDVLNLRWNLFIQGASKIL